jgi:hypothetical protein
MWPGVWLTSVIPAFRRMRQEDHEFKVSLHNEICPPKKKPERKPRAGAIV